MLRGGEQRQAVRTCPSLGQHISRLATATAPPLHGQQPLQRGHGIGDGHFRKRHETINMVGSSTPENVREDPMASLTAAVSEIDVSDRTEMQALLEEHPQVRRTTLERIVKERSRIHERAASSFD